MSKIVMYKWLWESKNISRNYLDEIMQGSKVQHRLYIDIGIEEEILSTSYILKNGDRFVIAITTNKKTKDIQFGYCYQKKVEE